MCLYLYVLTAAIHPSHCYNLFVFLHFVDLAPAESNLALLSCLTQRTINSPYCLLTTSILPRTITPPLPSPPPSFVPRLPPLFIPTLKRSESGRGGTGVAIEYVQHLLGCRSHSLTPALHHPHTEAPFNSSGKWGALKTARNYRPAVCRCVSRQDRATAACCSAASDTHNNTLTHTQHQ